MKKIFLVVVIMVSISQLSNAAWTFTGKASMGPGPGPAGGLSLSCPYSHAHCATFNDDHTVNVTGYGTFSWAPRADEGYDEPHENEDGEIMADIYEIE